MATAVSLMAAFFYTPLTSQEGDVCTFPDDTKKTVYNKKAQTSLYKW